MKLLVVSTVQTHPTTSGSASFINSYSSMLKEMGCDVYFLHVPPVYQNREDVMRGIVDSRQYWGNHYFVYRMSLINKIKEKILNYFCKYFRNGFSYCDNKYIWGLHSYVKKINKEYHFDACLVNYYWLTKLFTKVKFPKMGIITHDSFTYNNQRNGVDSILNLTPNEEAKALQRCPFIFAMQNEERVYFSRIAPKSKVLLSFCRYNFVRQPLTYNHNIVFLASSFYLNVNGLEWFLREIFPLILKTFSDCRLIIGGSICTVMSHLSSCSNIDLLGYVNDVADFYNMGDVAINPTYQGTGLKIKTFESVAYNKITLVHPHSISGMYKEELSPLFASEEPEQWVEYLKKVWKYDDFTNLLRKKNELYINSMNQFVMSQFNLFLDKMS